MDTTSLPEPGCWLSPLARVGKSAIEGHGLFAHANIECGHAIARFGGHLATDAELRQLFAAAAASDAYVDTLSIYDGINLVLPTDVPSRAGNHSCDPNMWWVDPYTVAARGDIVAGEELTLDYATITDDAEFTLSCRCGAERCRGRVTGVDWQLPELQQAYENHWVPVLRDRIRKSIAA